MSLIGEYDIGRYVECDACGADLTEDTRTGGLLFSGYAYGPCCEKKQLASIKRYGEEKFIRGRCTPGMAFADWVRAVRAQSPQGSKVRVYDGLPDLGGTP